MSNKKHRAHSRKRRKYNFHRQTKPGEPPGSIKTDPRAAQPKVYVIAFDESQLVQQEITDIGKIGEYLAKYKVTWINVEGLGSAALIQQLGDLLHLHALALEDVVNVHQRAKVEPYDSILFMVARMVSLVDDQVETEQISFFLGKQFVLTFQERPGDCLESVRQRIRKNGGRVRQMGSDYLMYALLDAVIDGYFPIAERLSDRLDALEDEIMIDQRPNANQKIHQMRGDLLHLRRALRPHRDAVNELIRDVHPLITPETSVFLRDCYDHTMQLIDLLEIYRETCADLRDFYLSMVSNRMNEIMKVLTIIATIFMPLTFIAGIYGMNFDTSLPGNMPELKWPFGYIAALGVMLAVTLGLIIYFRRCGWLDRNVAPPETTSSSPGNH